MPSDSKADLDATKSALADCVEDVFAWLYGGGIKRRTRSDWRSSEHESKSWNPRKRAFFDHKTYKGGSLLHAIQIERGYSTVGQAALEAREWLGGRGYVQPPRAPSKQARTDESDAPDADKQRGRDEAKTLWRRGRRIDGTAAEKYLRRRAIDRWPDDCARLVSSRDIRETLTTERNGKRAPMPSSNLAIVFPVTDHSGEVIAIQRIALNDDGSRTTGADGKKSTKLSHGPIRGGAVRFAGPSDAPLLLTEGPETGLSAWFAVGFETWSNLGSISKAPLERVPVDRLIIVCEDDDPRWSSQNPKAGGTRKTLKKAIKEWQREGRTVVVATPWAVSRGDKSDLSDVLQFQGVEAVRARIDAALASPQHDSGASFDDATAALRAAIDKTVNDLLAGMCSSPGIIIASLGLGKSTLTLKSVIPLAARGFPTVIAVPTHRLGADLVRDASTIAEACGAIIGVWRGRGQPDPHAEDENMCRNFEVAELARKGGLGVGETICPSCEHRESCGYLKQACQPADVWIVAHSLLLSPMPKVMEGTRLLVVDEDIALAGIDEPAFISPAELRDPAMVGSKRPAHRRRRAAKHVSWRDKMAEAGWSVDLQAELQPGHEVLARLVEAHASSRRGEYLSRAELVGAGITREQALQAAQLNRARMSDAGSLKDLSLGERTAALKALQPLNARAAKLAALWDHLADFLADEGASAAGRIRVVAKDHGAPELHIQGARPLGEGWRTLPALHLDATANLALTRVPFPQAWMAADIKAAEPHARYHQVVGKAFGKGALVEMLSFNDEQKTTARRLRDAVRRDILVRIAGKGGEWLVVTHEDVADTWRPLMPANVSFEHFGNLRGLNAYSTVTGIFIVGRWSFTPAAAEHQAAALTGRPTERVDGWYPQKTVTLSAADGTMLSVEVDEHPDPDVEAVRRAVVCAETEQASGRGRGVRRGADNPLEVTVYGNAVLPVALATLTEWTAPSFDEGMLGEFGVVLENAGDAALVAGRSRAAVKMARQRLVTNSYKKNYLYGNVTNLPAKSSLAYARYQRVGAGRSEASVIYDPTRIKRPGKWLAQRLGPVTLTALHKPDGASPRAPLTGMVACQITGCLDFALAPTVGASTPHLH